MSVGPLEILVILVLALLVFGPNKLPELARTVGRGMREVRRLQRMVQSELDDAMSESAPSPRPTAKSGDDRADAPAGDLPAGDGASGNGASGNGTSGDQTPRGEEPGSDVIPDSERDTD